ncbi:RDD family protein [Streptomyces sp. NPDC059650]|uniref:RDD family protein n=1 Tax=Streptomyces sp. NPDC059650 TaxID=3346896 RepID=UPI003680B936
MTASPGDGEHAAREGYYPDPSIPGYVRYWNGLSWVPGTSRPATPADRLRPALPDETSVTEALPDPDLEPEPDPEPDLGPDLDLDPDLDPEPERAPLPAPSTPLPAARADAWQADPLRQSGFGGPYDRRVSWGGDPAGRPEPEPAAGHAPARPAGAAPGRGPHPEPEPTVRRATGGAQGTAGDSDSGPGEGPSRGPEGYADRRPDGAPERGPGVSFARTPAASAAAAAAAERYPAQGVGILSARSPAAAAAAAAVQSAPVTAWPTVPGSGADSGMTSSWPQATERRAPAAPAAPRPEPQPDARPSRASAPARGAAAFPAAAEAPAAAVPPAAPTPRTSAEPPVSPADRGFADRTPAAAGPAQPPHTVREASATAAPAASPTVPVPARTTDRAVFEQMAERAVRPSGLPRRFLARALDSLVLGAVAAAVALPLVPAAEAHLQSKVDAARGTGRATTVWLFDATIAGYAGLVLGALVVFGLLYEVLPTARWGRTPGKKLLGVRVLSAATYRPPGFGAALSRWLVGAFLGPVGGLWCLADRPRRRAAHDRAAGTYVAR